MGTQNKYTVEERQLYYKLNRLETKILNNKRRLKLYKEELIETKNYYYQKENINLKMEPELKDLLNKKDKLKRIQSQEFREGYKYALEEITKEIETLKADYIKKKIIYFQENLRIIIGPNSLLSKEIEDRIS